MGGDAELGEHGRYCPGNPRLMVPKDLGAKATSPRAAYSEMPAMTISLLAVPCRAPPMPGT
jgi:hypothetical protein